MSILIKGMKMPKTCEECSFGYEEDVAWMACIPQGVSVRKESVSGICDPHCPLVEVPVPHGRLIDYDWVAGNVIKKLGIKDKQYLLQAEKALMILVDDAPTVIEAEGTE